jgi:hypothetical protein
MDDRRSGLKRAAVSAVKSATPPSIVVAAVLAALALRAPLLAQAVCTAPHSSIGLGQGGSLSTLFPGTGWVHVSGYAQDAAERFDGNGRRTPFFLGGESRVRSAYLTVAYGVIDGIDVWAQTAVHHLRYADQAGAAERTGVGDVRLAARVAAHRFGLDVPLNLRAGVKLPGSSFPVDARILPLSEGQVDAELTLESGTTFAEGALFAVGAVGHRWRFGESASGREPADEWIGRVGVGGSHGRLRWELAAEGLSGGVPLHQRIPLVTDRRRLLQLAPTLAFSSGPGTLDVSVQLPLVGRNLPSDHGMSAGYRLSW